MPGTKTDEKRLELHLRPTGRGRRLNAIRPDGSVFASGRTYRQLRERVSQAVAELYGPDMKVALLVGPAPRPAPGPSLVAGPSLPGRQVLTV
jgi:hypothetical protein